MSNIEENMKKILNSRFGKDVRQAIHDGIHDCYEDGKAGAVDLTARERIEEAITAEKSERQAADAAEKSERMQEIAVERARIDNLVANNNPTEGNSELIDIRVDVNGKTYNTAGGAVRANGQKIIDLQNGAFTNLKHVWETDTDYPSRSNGGTHSVGTKLPNKFTSNTSYGQYYFDFVLNNKYDGRTLMIVSRYLKGDYNPLDMSTYYYTESNQNLLDPYIPLKQYFIGDFVYILGISTIPNNVYRVRMSPFILSNGNSIEFEDYPFVILDVTGFSENMLSDLVYNFNDNLFTLFNKWTSNGISVESQHARASDVARFASSNIENYSDFDKFRRTNNDLVSFNLASATINNVTITAVGESPAGRVGVKYPFEIGKRYLVIITDNQKIQNFSFIKASGSGWHDTAVTSSVVMIDGARYVYGVMEPVYDDDPSTLYFGDIVSEETANITIRKILELPYNYEVTDKYIKSVIHAKVYDIAEYIERFNDFIQESSTESSQWYGKNVLFIGDSLTAAQKYQSTVANILGINIFNHAKGGVGLLAMVDGDKGLGGDYDNETDASGELKPLSVNDVTDKDLIILYGGYNNRGTDDGEVGDLYNPDGGGQSTIAGYMQYCINRIYEVLKEANNLTCKILIVAVDCAGKYPYINADGYEEYPADTGRTMETLANIQVAVAEHNSIPALDLWHNSGINKNTWNVFGASANAENTQYSKYQLDSSGEPINDTEIRYTKGNSYYQIRDGEAVYEEYTGDSPYPYNGDQLHKSDEGYKRIGECIAGAIIKSYGI